MASSPNSRRSKRLAWSFTVFVCLLFVVQIVVSFVYNPNAAPPLFIIVTTIVTFLGLALAFIQIFPGGIERLLDELGITSFGAFLRGTSFGTFLRGKGILALLLVLSLILNVTLILFETQASPTPGKTYREQEGTLGSVTYLNPYNLSGEGTKVEPGKWIEVSCKVLAPTIPSASPDGYWYRVASSPWSNAYYAIANTFMNGDVLGHHPYTHFTDSKVPDC